MKIQLRATPDFHIESKNPDNGYAFSIGASKTIGGDESGMRPMQVLLAALGGCSGIDVINILKKSRVDFDTLDVEIDGDRRPGEPSPFEHIRLRFTVRGRSVEKAKLDRAVKLSLEKYCSVAASLDPKIRIETVTEVTEV